MVGQNLTRQRPTQANDDTTVTILRVTVVPHALLTVELPLAKYLLYHDENEPFAGCVKATPKSSEARRHSLSTGSIDSTLWLYHFHTQEASAVRCGSTTSTRCGTSSCLQNDSFEMSGLKFMRQGKNLERSDNLCELRERRRHGPIGPWKVLII